MWDIILLIVLILLSGFFSGAEIAFMSLSRIRVNYLVESGKKNSKILKSLKDNQQMLLILILLCNNIVNIGASALATSIAIKQFGNIGIGIATGVMTLAILIFGEITPKAYCTYNAEKVSLFMSPFFKFLSKIFYPLVKLFYHITKGITKLLGVSSKKALVTEAEVISIIDLCENEGSIKRSEKEMINNIFKFDDITVGSIMVPRPDIVAFEQNNKVSDIIDIFVKEGFSRIPVYDGELNNIKGLLFVKDLIKADKNAVIKDILRPVMFVPETKKINSLFKEMSQNRKHLAIVVDEHGTVVGLITIEDLIEEILGEIYDETDEIKPQILDLKDGSYLVNGETQIKRINKKLGLKLLKDEHETLSSFILSYLEKIPKKGEEIKLPGCKLVFEEIKNNRIITVRFFIEKE